MNEKIWKLFFDNMQKILFPEVWLAMGLSMSRMELMALLLIWVNGEIIMTQLSENLDIPMSTATGVVGRLAKKGYVERLIDESNRRIVTVRLTERGKDISENIKKTINQYFDLILNTMTEQEKKTLYELFVRIFALFICTDVEDKEAEKTIKKIIIE